MIPDFAALAREMLSMSLDWTASSNVTTERIAAKLAELHAQWTKEEREAVLFDIFTAIGPKDGGALPKLADAFRDEEGEAANG